MKGFALDVRQAEPYEQAAGRDLMRDRDDVPLIKQDGNEEEEKTSYTGVIILGILVVCVIVLMYVIWKTVFNSPNLLQGFLDFCDSLAENSLRNWLLNLLMICLFQFAFLPGQSTYIAIVSFFIGSYPQALMRFVFVLWPVKLFGFLLVKYCIYERVYSKFKSFDIYQAINIESKKNPWSTSFLMNFMWIMSSLKMYLIPLLSISVWQFIPFMIPAEIAYSTLFALVGLQVKDIAEILRGKHEALTTEQKLSYIAVLFFTLLTGCFIAFAFYIIYRRVMQLQDQHREEQLAMQKNSPEFTQRGGEEVVRTKDLYVELPEGIIEN